MTQTPKVQMVEHQDEYIFDAGKLIIRTSVDVEPLIEEIQAEKNENPNGFSKSRNWRKIGSLPMIIIEKWLREKGIDLMKPGNEKYVKQALNEMTKFRTVDKML